MSQKRYYVTPLDNLGSVDPPPPRDRTWCVMDRETGGTVSDHYRRADARYEAARLNNNEADRKDIEGARRLLAMHTTQKES